MFTTCRFITLYQVDKRELYDMTTILHAITSPSVSFLFFMEANSLSLVEVEKRTICFLILHLVNGQATHIHTHVWLALSAYAKTYHDSTHAIHAANLPLQHLLLLLLRLRTEVQVSFVAPVLLALSTHNK
jgi:hypothetical protein